MKSSKSFDMPPEWYSTLVKTPSPYKESDVMLKPYELSSYVPFPEIEEARKMHTKKKSAMGFVPRLRHEDQKKSLVFQAINYLSDKYHDNGFIISKYSLFGPSIDEPQTIVTTTIGLYKAQMKDAVHFWQRCMFHPGIKVLFILSYLHPTNTSEINHVTLVIIDKVRKVVEFFDPHGSAFQPKHFFVDWIDEFGKLFYCSTKVNKTCFIPKTYKFVNYANSCPLYSFQTISEMDTTRSHLDPEGYCMLWSLFFLQARLSNMNIGTRELQEGIIECAENEVNMYRFAIPRSNKLTLSKKFMDFIRGFTLYYSNKMDEELDVLSRSLGQFYF